MKAAMMSGKPTQPSLASRLGADPRSLAAGRIAISIVLLIDLRTRWREIGPFLAPDAMFSLDQWRAAYEGTWVWSLYGWSANPSWPAVLLIAQLIFALMLLSGLFTRTATIASWLLATSLHMRNPIVINSGDTFLRMMLFWGMFSSWGCCWSVDYWLRHRKGRHSRPPAVWPSILLLVQVTFVYAITGWLKINDAWLHGEAMSRVMEMDYVLRPWGHSLKSRPDLLRWLTYATPWLELGALLAWSPYRTSLVRTLAVFSFIAFHAGIELTLHVGLFGLVSQASWLLFLPGVFWDRLGLQSPFAMADDEPVGSRTPSRIQLARTTAATCILAAIAAFSFGAAAYVNLQANALDPPRLADQPPRANEGIPVEAWLPTWIQKPMDALALRQDWTMFRNPPTRCNWVVARGEMASGEEVDLLRQRPWNPDGDVEHAVELPSQHWRYYFRRLTFPRQRFLANDAARFLLEDWNRNHQDDPAVRVRLVFFEKTFGQSGFRSFVLGTAGSSQPNDPDDAIDLDQMFRELDSALELP